MIKISKFIKINNYFFDNVTKYTPKPHIIGETRRTPFGGSIHTDYTNKYYTFLLNLEGVTPTQCGQLLYLVNLVFPVNGVPQNLLFSDDTNGSAWGLTFPIEVTIPIDGYSFERENGKEESYRWNLELWQVL